MDESLVIHLARRSLEVALWVSSPVLVVTLVVGFLVAMIQAVTSIRDQTMGMVVKLAAVGGTLLIFGGWMLNLMIEFTAEIFNHMQSIGH